MHDYVSMYVCVCVRVRVCVRACIHACIQACMHAYIHILYIPLSLHVQNVLKLQARPMIEVSILFLLSLFIVVDYISVISQNVVCYFVQ